MLDFFHQIGWYLVLLWCQKLGAVNNQGPKDINKLGFPTGSHFAAWPLRLWPCLGRELNHWHWQTGRDWWVWNYHPQMATSVGNIMPLDFGYYMFLYFQTNPIQISLRFHLISTGHPHSMVPGCHTDHDHGNAKACQLEKAFPITVEWLVVPNFKSLKVKNWGKPCFS